MNEKATRPAASKAAKAGTQLTDGESRSRWRQAAVPFAAALLVLAASFANFLSYHGYPLFKPEVAIVVVWLAFVAAVFAALHVRCSNFGKAILDGFLVFLAVDLNSDQTLVAAAVAAVVAFLRLGRGISLLQPLSIIAAVVLASAALGMTETRAAIARTEGKAPAATQGKAILHIILDEHGGIGGMSNATFRQQVASFYERHGFLLFERAYSRHFHTVNAIPDVLNFGHPGESRNVDETLDIGRTAYLSELEHRGYRLNLYQSDFADFCRYSRYASCTSYWSPSLGFVEPLSLPAAQKARLMAFKFTALSGLLQAMAGAIDDMTHLPFTRPLGIPVMAIKERAASGSLGGFAVLDRMTEDLASAQPGNVYFAHVLAPHFPYVMTSTCAVAAPSQWEYRRSSRPVAARKAAYENQVRCLTRRLDQVISAFLSSPAGRDGVIIFHGDHGSRITEMDPIEPNAGKLTPADLMAGYSTLFAVRGPKLAAGLDSQPYATPDILRQLARSDFTSLDGIPVGNGEVHLDGPNWTVGKTTSISRAWPDAD
jgi:hypothetical protein